MASNKAKRSIHLAQPERRSLNSQPATELMPVKAHVYRAMAELNGGFEKVIQDLKTLQQTSFLRSEHLADMHELICGIRAEANREVLEVLNGREMANAGHFASLRRLRKNNAREQNPQEMSSAG